MLFFNSTKQEKLKTTKLYLCWENEGTRTVRSSCYLLMLWVPWLIDHLLFFERVAQVDLQLNVELRLTLDSPGSPVPASWMLQWRACLWVCSTWCKLGKPSANWVTAAGHQTVSNYVSIPFFKIWRFPLPSDSLQTERSESDVMWLPQRGHKRVAFCQILSQVIFFGALTAGGRPQLWRWVSQYGDLILELFLVDK